MFDVEKLTHASTRAISDFVAAHPSETFYAFAVDADMLCFNSLERLEETVAQYRTKRPGRYSTAADVQRLKDNTGDWSYQGFFRLDSEHGFDNDLYDDYYNQYESGIEPTTENDYALAMTRLLENLQACGAFATLRRTEDFVATLAGHEY